MLALWSVVGVFAVGCVLFLVWHNTSTRERKTADANRRIEQAVEQAETWLAGGTGNDAQAIEQELAQSLEDDTASKTDAGRAVLEKLRQRRRELAQIAKREAAQRKADEVFDKGKRELDAGRRQTARELLKQYVGDQNATRKARAERLLREIEVAESDQENLDALLALNDEEFARARTSGSIDDGKVTHSALLRIREATIRRNIEPAARKRRDRKVAEQKRLEEAKRLKVAEARKKEAARLRVSVGGVPCSPDKVNVVYVSQAIGPGKNRAPDGEGSYGHIVMAYFDNKLPKAGSYFDVDGTAAKATVSINENKAVVLKDRTLHFREPGTAVVTVRLLKYSRSLRFKVVEIPIPPNPSQDEVVQALGFPDHKKQGSVTWPKSKVVDSLRYDPEITQFGPGIIRYEHWSYKKYPGLVLTWGDKFRLLTLGRRWPD